MPFEETKIAKSRITPRYSWNTAKVGFKHQSINQSKPRIAIGRVSTWVTCMIIIIMIHKIVYSSLKILKLLYI